MTAHTHTELVPGCYRCDLNKDEIESIRQEQIADIERMLREASAEKLNVIEDILETL